MAKKVNLAAAARQAGVSRQAASQARRKGRLVTDIEGLVEPEHAQAVLGKRRGRPAEPVPTQGGETLAQAQLRKERALADLREMEAARLRGELLPAENVRRALEASNAAFRDRLRAMPMAAAELCVEAAGKENPVQEVYRLLLGLVDEALEDIGRFVMVADETADSAGPTKRSMRRCATGSGRSR